MKGKRATLAILLSSVMSLISCTTIGSQQPVPARLENPSNETRKNLEKAFGSLLNSQPIKLSDKVFTTSHTVIIDQIKDNNGKLFNGREMRAADTFALLTQNGRCLLRHDQSGKTLVLKGIRCVGI